MITIKTAYPASEIQALDALRVDRLRLNPGDGAVTNLQITRGGPVVAGINVPTADLLAALDAVPTADMAREIGEEVARRREVEAKLAEAELTLTELAPADVLIEGSWFKPSDLPELLGNHMRAIDDLHRQMKADCASIAEWKARAEAAEAERDEYRMAAEAEAEGLNEWQARAKAAEETVARCRALLVFGTIEGDELRLALDPEPARKLPTAPGALIVVDDMPAEDGPVTLVLHDTPGDGQWYYLSGTSFYHARAIENRTWRPARITTDLDA